MARYTARVPDALCYQNHAEAFQAASAITDDLTMLLEVRGYWIVLRKSALLEAVTAVDNVEAERLESLKLIEDAKNAAAAAPTPKERKHG